MNSERRKEIEQVMQRYHKPVTFDAYAAIKFCLAEIDRLNALVAIAGEPEPPMPPARTFGSTVAALIAAQENVE